MASAFEILLQGEKIHRSKDVSVSLSLTTMAEADECLDKLLKPFGRSSFELIEDLNKSFRKINFWPWAIITFAHEYRLAGHVSATRHSRKDVVFSGYSVQDGFSVVRDGPPPMSMLFFRSKSVVSALASQSPLFSACWSVLADKPKNKNWLCVPDPLPESWVMQTEKRDSVLFSMIYVGYQGIHAGTHNQ